MEPDSTAETSEAESWRKALPLLVEPRTTSLFFWDEREMPPMRLPDKLSES